MIKPLLTAAALLIATPAHAGTVHDFNPALIQARRSLSGQCYTTRGDHKVCFYKLGGETFNVSILAPRAEFAHVFSVNCNTGRYKGFGPMSDNENAVFANKFCEGGRY